MMSPRNASAADPAMLLAFMAQQRLESDGNQEITAILPDDDTFGDNAGGARHCRAARPDRPVTKKSAAPVAKRTALFPEIR
jgi:hypothetical protein